VVVVDVEVEVVDVLVDVGVLQSSSVRQTFKLCALNKSGVLLCHVLA